MAEHAFLQHLREDHEKQKELGRKLRGTKNPEERRQLRNEFYEELYPHMLGEEASIFARLKVAENEEVRDDALEALQEHHVSKLVLNELMEIDVDGEIFKAKATVLDELNRHHIEEEEEDIFAHLQKLCSAGELSGLFEQYEKAEQEAESAVV